MMAGLEDFRRVLLSQIGYHEARDGSTKYGRWYGPGYAKADWCDMGLSWVAVQSGNTHCFGRFAYVPSHMQWFKERGKFYKNRLFKNSPIFFDWNGNGVPNHIGFLMDYSSDERLLYVCEFNHNDRVEIVKRPRNHYILGVGRVEWGPGVPTNAVDGEFYIA